MRRLFHLAALGLFLTGVGCYHTAGVCDCEPNGCGSLPTCPGCGFHGGPNGQNGYPVPGSPSSAMPKATDTGTLPPPKPVPPIDPDMPKPADTPKPDK
jgi:hypothetical protein